MQESQDNPLNRYKDLGNDESYEFEMAEATAGTTESISKSDGAEITLYYRQFRLEKSRSQRILWLFEELKVPYKLKLYHRGKDFLADPALKKVHPLGKSPVIGVKAPGAEKEIVIAESGAIVEYLIDHFGKWLEPKRYKEGMEGQVGGETEEWLRSRYFMHYAEGSLMTIMLVAFIISNIKNAPVPFFIRPITNGIASKINTMFLEPNFKTHFGFLEDQIGTSPGGGDFLCGKELTGADILMSFPLQVSATRAGLTKEKYPKLCAYVDRLEAREAYKVAVRKVEELDGSFSANL